MEAAYWENVRKCTLKSCQLGKCTFESYTCTFGSIRFRNINIKMWPIGKMTFGNCQLGNCTLESCQSINSKIHKIFAIVNTLESCPSFTSKLHVLLCTNVIATHCRHFQYICLGIIQHFKIINLKINKKVIGRREDGGEGKRPGRGGGGVRKEKIWEYWQN